MTVEEMRQAVRDARAADPTLIGQTRGFSSMRSGELADLLQSLPAPQAPVPGSHVVFDVETTGLSARKGDVPVQIGAEVYVPGQEPIQFKTYVDPGERAISPGAQKVHGISREMTAGAPSPEQAWQQLDQLIAGVGGVEYAAAHNLPFDIGFVPESSAIHRATQIDTLAMAKQLISRQEAGGSYRLSALTEMLGLPEFAAHDALADVHAAKQLLDTLVQMPQSGNIALPGIQPVTEMPAGAQAMLAGRQPPATQQQYQQPVPQSSEAQLDDVLTDFMRYGFGRTELRGMLREGLGKGTPQQARDFLTQHFAQQYGPEMPRERYSPVQQRYMEEHRRVRGRAELPWDPEREVGGQKLGPMPSARRWGEAEQRLGAQEPLYTRQGAAAFYPVSTLAQSGYWLPTEGGGVTMPVQARKVQKRGQMLGAHELVDIYQYESGMGRGPTVAPTGAGQLRGAGFPGPPVPSPLARETSQFAAMRGGPLSGVPARGTVLKTAMPLASVTESGMGALGKGVVESVRTRVARDIKLPEGFEPQGLAEAGATWGLGEGIRMFEGAQPLDIGMRGGAWEQARLVDLARTEEGFRAVLERSIAPERAGLYAKTGIGKMTMPVMDIEAFTGRADIEAIAEYKEPLGAAWSYMMAQRPEDLKEMLRSVGYEGDLPETWQEAGKPLVEAFQQALPSITEDITYRRTVHESAAEGYRELTERYKGSLEPIEGREGYYQWEATIPSIVAPALVPFGRDYPTKKPFYSSRELERMERTSPKVHRRVMEESRPRREMYQAIINAATASTGRAGAMPGAVTPTQEELGELGVVAMERAKAAVGAEKPGDIPRGVMQRMAVEAAAERYGKQPLEVEGGYLAAPEEARKFGTGRALETEEATRFIYRYGNALLSMMGMGGEEGEEGAIGRAIGAQEELGFSRKMLRSALGAEVQRGWGGRISGSPVLEPGEFVKPAADILRGYGLRPGSAEAIAFEKAWVAGDVTPTAMLSAYPTPGDEPFMAAMQAVHPEVARKRGMLLDPETPFVVSRGIAQQMGEDFDSDIMQGLALGVAQETAESEKARSSGKGRSPIMEIVGAELELAKPEDILRLGERVESYGAARLGTEIGQGPGTVANLQQALNIKEWEKYTPQELQEAYSQDLALREKIGPLFNVFERVMRQAGAGAGGGPGLPASQELFNMMYQRAQRPQRLPRALEELRGTLGYKPWTGGYSAHGEGLEGAQYGHITGFAGMEANILGAVGGMMLPGALGEGGGPALTPAQAAGLLAPGGESQELEDIFKELVSGESDWAMTMGRARGAMGGPEQFLQSALGGEAMTGAFVRAQQLLLKDPGAMSQEEYERWEKEVPKAERWLASLSPEMTTQLQEKAEARKAYRLAMSKRPPRGATPGTPEYKEWALSRIAGAGQAGMGAGLLQPWTVEGVTPMRHPRYGRAPAAAAGGAAPPIQPPAPPVAPPEEPEDFAATFGISPQEAGVPRPAQSNIENYLAGQSAAELRQTAAAYNLTPGQIDTLERGGRLRSHLGTVMQGRQQAPRRQQPPRQPPPPPGGPGQPPGEPPLPTGGGGTEGEAFGVLSRIMGVSARDFRTSVTLLNEYIGKWSEEVGPAVQGTKEYTEGMQRFTKDVIKLSTTVERGLRQGGWQGEMAEFAQTGLEMVKGEQYAPAMEQLRRADEAMRRAKIEEARAGGPPRRGRGGPPPGTPEWQMGALGAWGPLRGIDKAVRGVTSGWELMRLKRLWGMTGGYAMGQIPLAAGQEMAAAQVAAVGMPMGQYAGGDMAMQLMAYQAQQQQFKGQVGQAAYGAWGWAQQGATGQGLAQAAGIGLPALGAGLVGGSLAGMIGLSATGIGLPVALAAGAYGASRYAREAMGDRERMAIAAATGRDAGWDYRLAAYSQGMRPARGPGGMPMWGGPELETGPLGAYGARLRSGELAGLTGAGRIAGVQEATRLYAPEWMAPEQAMAGAQAWMTATPGATNIRDVYEDPRFAAMAMRGMQPQQFQQTAQQWGMDPGRWQEVLDQQLAVSQGEAQRAEWVAGQWEPLRQFGMEGEAVREMAYGRQQQMWDEEEGRWYTGRGEPELERLGGLGQRALTQWGAQAEQARLLGLTPAAPELGEGAAPIEEQRLQQLPLLQAQMGLQQRLVGMGAGGLGITEMLGENIGGMQRFGGFMAGQQMPMNLVGMMQAGMGTPGGVQMGAMQYDVAGEIVEPFTRLMDSIRDVNPQGVEALEGMFANLRPLTDPSGLRMGTEMMWRGFAEGEQLPTGIDRGLYEQYAGMAETGGTRALRQAQVGLQTQYQDWQSQQQERSLRWSETAQFGGEFEGFQTRGSFAIQRELRQLTRIWQEFTREFQQEQRQLQYRQFMENWEVRAERMPTQFQWQREDLAFQGAQQTLQYAWGQEDIQERMRYATGRERRQLMKQQGRQTIQYAMGQGRLATQEERLGVREQWAKEDLEREKRHFLERFALQDKYQERYNEYSEKRRRLEDELQDIREFGARFQLEQSKERLERQKELRKHMDAISEVQTTINKKLENAVALQQVFASNLMSMLISANVAANRVKQTFESIRVPAGESYDNYVQGVIGGR